MGGSTAHTIPASIAARCKLGHGKGFGPRLGSIQLSSIISMSTESVNLPSRNSLRASRPHTAQVIVFATICYSESPATIALPRNSRTALSLGAGGKHDLRRGDEQRLRVVLQGQRARERVWARAATRAIASPATGPIHRT